MRSYFENLRHKVMFPIYVIGLITVFAFVFSKFYVLYSAGGVADQIRRDVEQKLVQNEVSRQIEILSYDQSQVSHWDEMVRATGAQIDQAFLREKVGRWLWEDFRVQYSIIISPDLKARSVLFEYGVKDAAHGQKVIDENADLIEKAHDLYLAQRQKTEQGYQLAAHPVRSDQPIHTNGFRMVHGQLGLIAVQAITPHQDLHLPEGKPQTLLTFKPLQQATIREIGRKLGLKGLSVVQAGTPLPDDRQTLILADDGTAQFAANWEIASPFDVIWLETSEVIVLLMLVIGSGMIAIFKRHGRALQSLHESEQANRFLAQHDSMTKLPNRFQFEAKLDEMFAGKKPRDFALLCIDLDKFKAVNDTFGHHAGDIVIKTAAKRLSEVTADRGMVARIGGDEFMAIIWSGIDIPSLKSLTDQMILEVCRDIEIDEGVANIGASIGVARAPIDAQTPQALVQKADAALYRAKDLGRNNAQFVQEDAVDISTTSLQSDFKVA